jgi:hypothetical protein
MLRVYFNPSPRPRYYHVLPAKSPDEAFKLSVEMMRAGDRLNLHSPTYSSPNYPKDAPERNNTTEWAAYAITYDPIDALKLEYALEGNKGKKHSDAVFAFPPKMSNNQVILRLAAIHDLLDSCDFLEFYEILTPGKGLPNALRVRVPDALAADLLTSKPARDFIAAHVELNKYRPPQEGPGFPIP